MGDPWFRVEKTGLAAQPTNWKGWAVIGVYIVALLAWIVVAFGVLGPTGPNIAIFLVGAIAVTVVLVVVAMKKTEGEWAWRRNSSAEND